MPAAPSPAVQAPEWVTLQEAAHRLSLSWRTVRRMCDDGRLTAKRFGRVLRVHRDSLDRLASPTAAA